MKLLSAFLVVVTLTLALVWGISNTSDKGVAAVHSWAGGPATPFDPPRKPARLEVAHVKSEAREASAERLEVTDAVAELDLPDSDWMLGAPPEIEPEHPDGPWLLRHENGEIHEQGAYEDDLEIGRWLWFYEDGTRMAVGDFDQGNRIGSWTWWHDTGELMAEGQYRDGEGFGPWRTYHEDGSRRGEGHFSGDEKSGPWVFWNPDGSVDEEDSGYYEAGALVE